MYFKLHDELLHEILAIRFYISYDQELLHELVAMPGSYMGAPTMSFCMRHEVLLCYIYISGPEKKCK